MVAFDGVDPSERYRPMAQDPHPRIAGYRVADASLVAGAGVWVALAGLSALGSLAVSATGLLLALALLVVTPLAASLVATRRRSGGRVPVYWLAVLGQAPAALAAVAALVVRPAPLPREALVLPWLVVGLALVAFAGWRLGSRGPFPLAELAIDASLLGPAVGAVLLLLGGFPATGPAPSGLAVGAVRGHNAVLVLPLVAGLAARVGTGANGRFPRTLGGALDAGATAVFVLVLPLLAVVAATTGFIDPGALVVWHGGLGALGVAVPALAAFRLG